MTEREVLTARFDTEAGTIADLGALAAEPTELETGTVYAVANPGGPAKVVDTDEYAEFPRRANSSRTVTDAASFNVYMAKHGHEHSEVWADQTGNRVIGIIDAHQGAGEPAGWEKHQVRLSLEHTKSWLAWANLDGQLIGQIEFADFIEDRAGDVTTPSPAELVELARRFEATKSLEFESGERDQDGQTTLKYVEKSNAKGNITIPEKIQLVLQPYVGGPKYWAWARFRYRISGANLLLGYVLERPEILLDNAFVDIVEQIRSGRPEIETRDATATSPAVLHQDGFEGITQPIFNGRP